MTDSSSAYRAFVHRTQLVIPGLIKSYLNCSRVEGDGQAPKRNLAVVNRQHKGAGHRKMSMHKSHRLLKLLSMSP